MGERNTESNSHRSVRVFNISIGQIIAQFFFSDPTSGSAAEEVNFWISLERALTHIEQQLQSAEVEATLAVLKQAKRFLAAVSFETDTGIAFCLRSLVRSSC